MILGNFLLKMDRLVAGMVWGSTAGQIEYANESAILLRLLEMDNTEIGRAHV